MKTTENILEDYDKIGWKYTFKGMDESANKQQLYTREVVKEFMKLYAKQVIDEIKEEFQDYIELDYGNGFGDCSCSADTTNKWEELKEKLI